MSIGETQTPGRKAVEMGRGNRATGLAAVGPEIAVAHVVGVQDDQVRHSSKCYSGLQSGGTQR